MAWTYAAFAVPADLDRDTVRFYVGDTRAEDPLVQDEEIAGVLALTPEPRLAAAAVCDSLAATFSRLVDVSTGSKRTSLGQLAERYAARAKTLRDQEGASTGAGSGVVVVGPYAAGLSIQERRDDREDEDLPRPVFGTVGHGPVPVAPFREQFRP